MKSFLALISIVLVISQGPIPAVAAVQNESGQDQLSWRIPPSDKAGNDSTMVDEAVNLAKTLRLPIQSRALRDRLMDIVERAKAKGLIFSGYSVSLFVEAGPGVGGILGHEWVFSLDLQNPKSWNVTSFDFKGAFVGPKAQVSASMNINLIFNMDDVASYSGYFCGLSANLTTNLGGGGLAQTSCLAHKGSRVVTVGIIGSVGWGGGASVSISKYKKRKTLEIPFSALGEYTQELGIYLSNIKGWQPSIPKDLR
jgi:hypothetical protein